MLSARFCACAVKDSKRILNVLNSSYSQNLIDSQLTVFIPSIFPLFYYRHPDIHPNNKFKIDNDSLA